MLDGKSQVKGYLPLLLLLLLLPSLVVSRNPRQQQQQQQQQHRPVANEALEKRSRGLMIGPSLLIARPEKRSGADYGASAKKLLLRPKRLDAGLVVAAHSRLHQQSTNSAAAKRDLNYKQRAARGTAADSRTISGAVESLHEKRRQGRFLPGQVNSLTPVPDENPAYEARAVTFHPPRLIYVEPALPQPFLRPEHRQRGRLFGLTNFLIKGRPPSDPRSFKPTKEDREAKTLPIEKPMENGTEIMTIKAESPSMTVNEAKVQDNQGYALYHQIIDDELEVSNSATVRSFEANSVLDDATDSAPTERDEPDEDDQPDWDANESRSREVVDRSQDNSSGRYEFGYRVIDRASGSDFGHEESRLGRATSGRYHVLLPDGRVQRVEYFVDRAGYHADVSYARKEKVERENEKEEEEEEEEVRRR